MEGRRAERKERRRHTLVPSSQPRPSSQARGGLSARGQGSAGQRLAGTGPLQTLPSTGSAARTASSEGRAEDPD